MSSFRRCRRKTGLWRAYWATKGKISHEPDYNCENLLPISKKSLF
jgi:hypothetical protein